MKKTLTIYALGLLLLATAFIATCTVPMFVATAAIAPKSHLLLDSSNYLNRPVRVMTRHSGEFIKVWTTDGAGDEATVRQKPHLAAAMGAKYLILDIESANAIQAATWPNNPQQAVVATMFQAIAWVRSENVPGVKLGLYGAGTGLPNSLAVYEQADIDVMCPGCYTSEWLCPPPPAPPNGVNLRWKDAIGVEIAACRAVRPNVPIVAFISPRITYDSPLYGPQWTMLPMTQIQTQINYLCQQCQGVCIWDGAFGPANLPPLPRDDWAKASWLPLILGM